jgi:hypothetical protein
MARHGLHEGFAQGLKEAGYSGDTYSVNPPRGGKQLRSPVVGFQARGTTHVAKPRKSSLAPGAAPRKQQAAVGSKPGQRPFGPIARNRSRVQRRRRGGPVFYKPL